MKKEIRLLWLLAALKLVIPFFLQHPAFEPHRDEFLYLAEGHHMAWGYMEIPPLLSVFAWITDLLGGGLFWIKCWPVLFGALTFWLTGRLVLHLGGKSFALLLAWLPFMLDGYMRLFFLFQPNFLDVFFWTLLAYSLVRFAQTEKSSYLYLFGIAAGLGMMSKYSVAFYLIGLLAGILLIGPRRLFRNKHFYLAALLGLLLFLPNLLWQYFHRFPVLVHMNELEDQQLRYIHYLDFLKGQLLMNTPCVYIWLAGLAALLFSGDYPKFRFVGLAYLATIAVLLLLHGKAYYALGAYPALFTFGATWLEKKTSHSFRWTRYAMLSFSIALGLLALPLVMPLFKPEKLVAYYKATGLNKTGDFIWEDQQRHPLPQDFADMIGWKEMASQLANAYRKLPASVRDSTLIYCRGYYTAGALNYYGPRLGLPTVYSDNASFLLWMPDHYQVRNLILVGHYFPEPDDIVFQQFEESHLLDSVNNPLFRENGMKFILFRNGNDSLNSYIEKSIQQQKDRFRR